MSGAPRRTLHGENLYITKTCLAHFVSQLFRTMKVRGGEILRPISRIAVLTRGKITGNHLAKLRVSKEPSGKSVDKRSETGNCSGEEHSAGFEDAMGLTKRAKAVSVLNKMIKRTEEKNGVGSTVINVKMASVA